MVDVGYRELLLNTQNKSLDYYRQQNKVFWVINADINNKLKSNQVCPCLFVEKIQDQYKILQFDYSIKFDQYQYTTWRKLIGEIYGIHVDVLLISDDELVTLNGKTVNFNQLGRSEIVIDKKYLAKFSVISN